MICLNDLLQIVSFFTKIRLISGENLIYSKQIYDFCNKKKFDIVSDLKALTSIFIPKRYALMHYCIKK